MLSPSFLTVLCLCALLLITPAYSLVTRQRVFLARQSTPSSLNAAQEDINHSVKRSNSKLFKSLASVGLTASLFIGIPLTLTPSPSPSASGTFMLSTNVANAYNENADGAKKFEACVSRCTFNGTKPPPAGSTIERLEATSSVSRVDIIKACRKQCAKTPDQLLLGTQKKERTPQQKVEMPPPPALPTSSLE